MSLEDSHKMIFFTLYVHYEFNRLPFGIKNTPACFQRLMNITLSGLIGADLFLHFGDIVIYANSLEEHRQKMYFTHG